MRQGKDSNSRALQSLLCTIDQPCLFSTSVKLTQKAQHWDRWLLTLPSQCCASSTTLTKTLHALTPELSEIPLPQHPKSFHPIAIHVGFDQDNGRGIRKLYFEFEGQDELIFIATKSAHGIHETHFYRSVSARIILEKLNLPEPLKLKAQYLLDILPLDVAALDVTTSASPRHSLDINITEVDSSQLLLDTISQFIKEICYSDSIEKMIFEKPISHLAVGLQSSGTPFVTLYGEPRWITPNSSVAQ